MMHSLYRDTTYSPDMSIRVVTSMNKPTNCTNVSKPVRIGQVKELHHGFSLGKSKQSQTPRIRGIAKQTLAMALGIPRHLLCVVLLDGLRAKARRNLHGKSFGFDSARRFVVSQCSGTCVVSFVCAVDFCLRRGSFGATCSLSKERDEPRFKGQGSSFKPKRQAHCGWTKSVRPT